MVIGGGFLVALLLLLLLLSDLFFYLVFLLCILMAFLIAQLVIDLDPGGWRGYLARVGLTLACALVGGLWVRVCYWVLCSIIRLVLKVGPPDGRCELWQASLVGLLIMSISFFIAGASGKKSTSA